MRRGRRRGRRRGKRRGGEKQGTREEEEGRHAPSVLMNRPPPTPILITQTPPPRMFSPKKTRPCTSSLVHTDTPYVAYVEETPSFLKYGASSMMKKQMRVVVETTNVLPKKRTAAPVPWVTPTFLMLRRLNQNISGEEGGRGRRVMDEDEGSGERVGGEWRESGRGCRKRMLDGWDARTRC